MLKKFAVENYRNFKDRIEIDFGAVRNYSFNEQCVKDGVMNKVILVGKNGTGKTNLGLAIFDITAMLTDNIVQGKQIDLGSYINGTSKKKRATFEYTFQRGDDILEYTYAKADPYTIVHEELKVNGNTIFARTGRNGNYEGLKDIGADQLRMNIGDGRLSILRYIYANTLQNEDSPVTFIVNFAEHMLYFKSDIDGNGFIGFKRNSEGIYDYIIKNNLIDDFRNKLKDCADIDAKFGVIKMPGSPGIFVQKFENKDLPFDAIASTGTRVFALFYYWYKQFNNVKFLYMDEFDAYYHYEMAEKIVKLVSSMDGFQTVFTSHNTSLLHNNLMRPDCCLTIENGSIRSFADSTGRELRQGHNLEKMYRNGEFDE